MGSRPPGPGPYSLEPQLTSLPTRLRRAAEVAGLKDSQAIADASGLTAKSVRKYLMGTSLPNSVALVRLARSCGVTPGWLLGNTVREEARRLVYMCGQVPAPSRTRDVDEGRPGAGDSGSGPREDEGKEKA